MKQKKDKNKIKKRDGRSWKNYKCKASTNFSAHLRLIFCLSIFPFKIPLFHSFRLLPFLPLSDPTGPVKLRSTLGSLIVIFHRSQSWIKNSKSPISFLNLLFGCLENGNENSYFWIRMWCNIMGEFRLFLF